MDAHRVAVEEEELLVDVFKAVVFVVDGPFGVAVVFLAVGAAIVVDVAFEAGAFLIAFVPFAAEGARLHAGTAIAFLVQLVVNDNVIHLHVLDLIIDVHEDDVGFDILGAFTSEVTSSWAFKRVCCKSMSMASGISLFLILSRVSLGGT